MGEVDRMEVIREVLGRRLRQGEASERLGICVRQVKRLVRRQWPSPGSAGPLPAPCSPIPVSTVYAPMSTTGIRRPCGALTPCLHHAHRSRSRVPLAQVRTRPPPHLPQNPEPFRRSHVHHRHRLPTGPDHPQAPRRTVERAPVGPLCAVSSKASTVSPPPSAERTAVPSTSARPPVPSNPNSKSTPLSISTPHPVVSPN